MSNRFEYDYGIAHRSRVIAGEALTAHRRRMSEREAQEWLRQWRENCKPQERDMFVLIRRPLGKWEIVPTL